MEIIYTHEQLDPTIIEHLLERLFPARKVYFWDFNSEPPVGLELQDEKAIVCKSEFDSERIEFNNCLTIYRFPKEGEDERTLHIAKKLSAIVNGQTLTAYTHPGHPTDPYYIIVFNCGSPFLADDSNSNLADRTGLKVKIVGPWHLPSYKFDEWGNLLKHNG